MLVECICVRLPSELNSLSDQQHAIKKNVRKKNVSKNKKPGPACPPRDNIASLLHAGASASKSFQMIFSQRNFRQPSVRFGSDRRACAVFDNVCMAIKETFSLTLLRGIFLEGWLLPHRPGAAHRDGGPAPLRDALCLSSRGSYFLPS